jgi:hypothetical protein
MNARPVLRTLVAAGALAALGIPGASYAESFKHQDATHDVQRFDVSTETVSRADHNKAADIVKSKLAYTQHHLAATVWVRGGSIENSWIAAGTLHVKGGDDFQWYGGHNPMGPGTSFQLMDSDGNPVTCDFGHDVAHHKGRLTVTIPASCVGKPDWLKASIAYGYFTSQGDQMADDGLQKRGLQVNSTFALSPKLHRG